MCLLNVRIYTSWTHAILFVFTRAYLFQIALEIVSLSIPIEIETQNKLV